MHDADVAVDRDDSGSERGDEDGAAACHGDNSAQHVSERPHGEEGGVRCEQHEDCEDDVGQRQVGDEQIGGCAHPSCAQHRGDHQRVAAYAYSENGAVDDAEGDTCA